MVEYDGNSIVVLEGLDAVRKRPAMYIGSTDYRGIHHLIYEVLDNSVDEAMAGFCDHIRLIVHVDNSITISDNGRGIPVDLHPTENISSLQVVLTKLHAGGKFDHNSYKVSGGLHGVGVSVVNALSEWLKVEVRRNEHFYVQQYVRGCPLSEPKVDGKADCTGTTVIFRPDENVFGSYDIDFNLISERCKELAYLNAGLCIDLLDERTDLSFNFKFKGGIKSLLRKIAGSKKAIHAPVDGCVEFDSGTVVDFVFFYVDDNKGRVLTFCNNIRTQEGGTHLSGFKTALTRTFNTFIHNSAVVPKKFKQYRVTGDDILTGLFAIVNIKVVDPQFEGQTKTKLGNSDVAGEVQSAVSSTLSKFLNEQSGFAKSIIARLVLSVKEREAAKRAKDIIRKRSSLSSVLISSKLADCRSRDIRRRELFIVEGDSAGGSAKQARDPEFQAVLPLRGKVLNIEKADDHRIIQSKAIQSLIASLGIGFGNDVDLRKLRYDKIIIMTDADIDGAHIRTLLLTFFFRQFNDIIQQGHLYISQPPLYRVHNSGFEKFIASDDELEDFLVNASADILTIKDIDGRTYRKSTIITLLNRMRELQGYLRAVSSMGIPESLFKTILDYPSVTISGVYKSNFHSYMQSRGFPFDLKKETLSGGRVRENLNVNCNRRLIKIPLDFFESQIYRNSCRVISSLSSYSSKLRFRLFEDPEVFDCYSLYVQCLEVLRSKYSVQRYKGLGEMNPEQLWKTTMDVNTRSLLRVRILDAEAADRSFRMLMGNDVEARRNFIELHSTNVSFLDL